MAGIKTGAKPGHIICLDTNYLIRGLLFGTREAEQLKIWLKAGILLEASSIVWYEFLCGPVQSREIETMRAVLTGGILSFGDAEADEAARLFNAAGRQRRLRVDAMIAGTAVCVGAALATYNFDDFAVFRQHGLVLIN